MSPENFQGEPRKLSWRAAMFSQMHKASLYIKKHNNLVQCCACNHYCCITPNKTGICGVRQNINGDLYLLVYGNPVALNIDPIEKKPLYHFLPGTKIFSLGTLGCNFKCQFCQNWDISQKVKSPAFAKAMVGKQKSKVKNFLIDAEQWPPSKIVDYCLANQIPSIAYTYNEPAIFFEYAYDIAKLAYKKGIKNVFVSNGYESKECLSKIKKYLSAINIDLKSFREEFYQKICGAKLKPVLENIKRIKSLGIHLEITTLIIPGYNDSKKELKQITAFLVKIDRNIPWHISRFYPSYKMQNIPATSLDKLKEAYHIGKRAGLYYVYVGNIISTNLENTYCAACNNLLIKRKAYDIKFFSFSKGVCSKCKEKIKGVWK